MTTMGEDRTAELWVRSFAPVERSARRDRVIEGLEALVEMGALDSVTVRVWGDEVVVDGDQPDPAREIIDRVDRFEDWAEETGVSLAPTFERRTVDCSFTETRCVSQRLPAMALAEYRDGAVVHVTPHVEGGTCRSVADRVGEAAAEEADREEESTVPLLAD